MSPISDLELVEKFQQGDEASFNEVVKRYQEKIYWVARRIVGEHESADDIAQEVFIKAYSALIDFRGESAVYTWLYRVAVNLSLNCIRRRKIRKFFRIDDFFDLEADEDENPDTIFESIEHNKLLDEAIERLPEKQKKVFVLRYQEGLSYEEISQILKTSVGGLKANYFHAIKKIGEYINRAHTTHSI